MDRAHVGSCLLGFLIALHSGDSSAQGRGPPAAKPRTKAERTDDSVGNAKLENIDSWLKLLRGRFQISSPAVSPLSTVCTTMSGPNGICLQTSQITRPSFIPSTSPLEGSMECIEIGSGSGLSCVFAWNSGAEWLPISALYGVDPIEQKVRLLWVLNSGSATESESSLIGNTVNFKMGNGAARIEINATPGSKVIYLSTTVNARGPGETNTISGRLELRRQSSADATDPDPKAPRHR